MDRKGRAGHSGMLRLPLCGDRSAERVTLMTDSPWVMCFLLTPKMSRFNLASMVAVSCEERGGLSCKLYISRYTALHLPSSAFVILMVTAPQRRSVALLTVRFPRLRVRGGTCSHQPAAHL